MSQGNLYWINIASEFTMIVVLGLLLITYFLQRRRFAAAKPLLYLVGSTILLMLCQIIEWTLMLASVGQSGAVPVFYEWKILTYSLDYLLGCLNSVSFYHYVSSHIQSLYQQKGIPSAKGRNWKNGALIGWSVAMSALFYILIRQPWFYYLDGVKNEQFDYDGYLFMYCMAMVITLFTFFKTIRHRKILGGVNTVLLLFYKVTPILLLIPDLLQGTSLSYLIRGVYTVVLYLHIDLKAAQESAEREARLAKQEKELTEMRTQIMLSQMQPHFLYNTLTTISSLCYLENAPQAKAVVDKFAVYFRQNLDSMGKDKMVSFEKELEHIRIYLWIEKVRFEDKLTVVYDIGPSDFHLPSLSLQPLVENAVKHGLCKQKNGGTLTISTGETGEEYRVSICDDGVGFVPGEVPDDNKSHIGIENISQRLEILCGGSLEIQSTLGVGTHVTVHLPKEQKI